MLFLCPRLLCDSVCVGGVGKQWSSQVHCQGGPWCLALRHYIRHHSPSITHYGNDPRARRAVHWGVQTPLCAKSVWLQWVPASRGAYQSVQGMAGFLYKKKSFIFISIFILKCWYYKYCISSWTSTSIMQVSTSNSNCVVAVDFSSHVRGGWRGGLKNLLPDFLLLLVEISSSAPFPLSRSKVSPQWLSELRHMYKDEHSLASSSVTCLDSTNLLHWIKGLHIFSYDLPHLDFWQNELGLFCACVVTWKGGGCKYRSVIQLCESIRVSAES